MYAASSSQTTGTHIEMPVARIDAQDKSSVLPLREYLETHGVKVFVNSPQDLKATYHIVIGEDDFVKKIFFRTQKTGIKKLAIVVGYPYEKPVPAGYHGKIIFLDPKEISEEQVLAIFNFLFASEKDFLDLRTQSNARTAHEAPPAELPERDQKRIGHIIKDVFGDSKKPPLHRKKKRRRWIIGVLIGFGMMIIPAVWYFLSITVSGVALAAGARALAAGKKDTVDWQINIAQYWIKQGSSILSIASGPFAWAGLEVPVRGQERLLSFYSDAAASMDEIHSMLETGQNVAAGLLNQVDVNSSGTTPAADITALRTSLESVGNMLGLAQAQLTLLVKDRTFPFSIPFVSRKGIQIVSELSKFRDWTTNMDRLVSLFLHLSGFKEPKTYLILLQNSTELRPTGGFIGSVALASFEEGRMTDLSVQDVYTFDGQLKGHVDPPIPIRELLGQEHWYLRDSNWNPDFAESARRAAWFYQKETGNSIDGVFAVNTPFIVEILKATGAIDLSDYNDRITADNFYGKSLYYTQNDFFPGSTQKKDFLGTLMRTLITKITTGRTTNMTALFRAVIHSLDSHDFLMMFGSAELQSVIAHYGWAGKIPSTTGCEGAEAASCSFDPLIIIEANMGVNKVNYFINRTTDRKITVNANGSISEAVTTTIKNTSGQESGKPYRTYIRMMLPADVAVTGVALDGIPVPSRKDTSKPPAVPYLERTDEPSDFYVLGIGMDIPTASEKHLSVMYTRDNFLHFGPGGAVFDLFIQKQPGVQNASVHTIVQYPSAWTAGIEEQPGLQDFIANPGQLEYNTILESDALTRIRFTKDQ